MAEVVAMGDMQVAADKAQQNRVLVDLLGLMEQLDIMVKEGWAVLQVLEVLFLKSQIV